MDEESGSGTYCRGSDVTMPGPFSLEHSRLCVGLPTRTPGAGPGTAVLPETKEEVRAIKNEMLETFEKKAPKLMDCLEEGFEESLTILSFPRKYRVRLGSTNFQERLYEEVRRRERVIRIFSNEDSAIRIIRALLPELLEQWSTGKKYFDMAEYLEWKTQEPLETPSLLSVIE